MKTKLHICLSVITLLSVGAIASTIEVLRDDFFQKIGLLKKRLMKTPKLSFAQLFF